MELLHDIAAITVSAMISALAFSFGLSRNGAEILSKSLIRAYYNVFKAAKYIENLSKMKNSYTPENLMHQIPCDKPPNQNENKNTEKAEENHVDNTTEVITAPYC